MSIKHLMILNNEPSINLSSSVFNRQPEPISFQTGHSLLTRYPVKIASHPPGLDAVDSPSSKVLLDLPNRRERARRARVEEARKIEPQPAGTATTDDPTKTTPVQPSPPEPPRKRIPSVKQVASTNPKPSTLADTATNPNTPAVTPPTPPGKAPVVDSNPPANNTRAPISSVPSTPADNATPTKSTPQPAAPGVVPLTPTTEANPAGAAAKDKPATAVSPPAVPAKTPIDKALPTTNSILPLTQSPATSNSAQREITPNVHKESGKIESVSPESNGKGNTSQLTSIAIGVGCAASLVVFAILVVIFKIKVSRKRARKQERFGDDFFGSHDRLSFSDSDGSRKSEFVVPRPIGSKFPSTPSGSPELGKEKHGYNGSPLIGIPNHAGIGAHSSKPSSTHSLTDSPRNHVPTHLNFQSNSDPDNYLPPRPPRSPLRPGHSTQKPEAFYHPQHYVRPSNSYTPDSQSIYSTNTATRTGAGKAKALPAEFYGHPTHEHNYAMEYLEDYYPESNQSSTFQSNVDPHHHPHHQQQQFKQNPAEMIGMEFMQVEDRPYDHRYTVDRNGVLNNYAPSIPPVPVPEIPRDSDYFYKKRIT
ncbi:hypothetical protein MJO29_009097 [Puccinia striiformis f. sp. tritici]|nr:hypothetical protein MJO29_009097 [Puccinia striiformis f. sp. tritici]